LSESKSASKKFFFCTSKNLTLQQMPELTEPFEKLASSLGGGRFLGQPGKLLGPDADAPEEEELDENGNPKPKKVKFSEGHLLAYTVNQIDHDTAVVPRGAFVVSPTHHVASSPLFAGLAGTDAASLASYLHFRPAEHPSRKHALTKSGVVPAMDFLDPCSEDSPTGVWSVRVDNGRGLAELRSLKWPGYFAYHLVGSSKYGAIYVGDGVENTSLQFML
jgi:radial spoke head protein 9